jgi:hypothetical protein
VAGVAVRDVDSLFEQGPPPEWKQLVRLAERRAVALARAEDYRPAEVNLEIRMLMCPGDPTALLDDDELDAIVAANPAIAECEAVIRALQLLREPPPAKEPPPTVVADEVYQLVHLEQPPTALSGGEWDSDAEEPDLPPAPPSLPRYRPNEPAHPLSWRAFRESQNPSPFGPF